MNVIARLEYELAYYDSAVHHFNHYTTRTPPNIIKDDLRLNERTKHFFIKMYLPSFVVSWEIDGETYNQRDDFFPYILPGPRVCQRLHPVASSSETPLIGCVSHARSAFSTHCPNLTAWFPSRSLFPVTHLLYPTALIVLPCLLITTWQLVKAHGVTRNEPKIHGICYITCSTMMVLALNKSRRLICH